MNYFKQNKFMAVVAGAVGVIFLYLIYVMFVLWPSGRTAARTLYDLVATLERKDPKDPEFPSAPRIDDAGKRKAEMKKQLQDIAAFYEPYEPPLETWITGAAPGQIPPDGEFEVRYTNFRTELEKRMRAALGSEGLGYEPGKDPGFSWDPFNPGVASQKSTLNKRCQIQDRITRAFESFNPNPQPAQKPPRLRLEEVYFPGQTSTASPGAVPVFPLLGARGGGLAQVAALPSIVVPVGDNTNAVPLGTLVPFGLVARCHYADAYKIVAQIEDADAEPKMLIRLRALLIAVVRPLPEKITIWYERGQPRPNPQPEDVFDRSEYEPIRAIFVFDVYDFDGALLTQVKKIE